MDANAPEQIDLDRLRFQFIATYEASSTSSDLLVQEVVAKFLRVPASHGAAEKIGEAKLLVHDRDTGLDAWSRERSDERVECDAIMDPHKVDRWVAVIAVSIRPDLRGGGLGPFCVNAALRNLPGHLPKLITLYGENDQGRDIMTGNLEDAAALYGFEQADDSVWFRVDRA